MIWKSSEGASPQARSASGLVALASLGGSFAASLFAPSAELGWAGAFGSLILFCAAIGVAINGRVIGLLIDDRNRVSLARFQASAWSVLVLSALVTVAVTRIRMSEAEPLAIAIPGPLLVAMGMSVASLVSSPAVLSLKAGEIAQIGNAGPTAARLGDSASDLAPHGSLYARSDPARARWLDMFRGDEVCTAAAPDLSKVQQFLVTTVVLGTYAATLWSALSKVALEGAASDPSYLRGLPDFSPNMLWLIGVSHAGYLAYKAAPHGPAPQGPTPAVTAVG
jgi:hypothetical protein